MNIQIFNSKNILPFFVCLFVSCSWNPPRFSLTPPSGGLVASWIWHAMSRTKTGTPSSQQDGGVLPLTETEKTNHFSPASCVWVRCVLSASPFELFWKECQLWHCFWKEPRKEGRDSDGGFLDDSTCYSETVCTAHAHPRPRRSHHGRTQVYEVEGATPTSGYFMLTHTKH